MLSAPVSLAAGVVPPPQAASSIARITRTEKIENLRDIFKLLECVLCELIDYVKWLSSHNPPYSYAIV
jgi:hypothetical protein